MVLEWLLIAVALAMDCFAVSVVIGVISRSRHPEAAAAAPYPADGPALRERPDLRSHLRTAFFFGLFQALMPLLGWLLTHHFSTLIRSVDHWIAFGMLAFIGVRMIIDSFRPENVSLQPGQLKTQLMLAVATSIDAAAVGISFACTGYDRFSQLIVPLILIGSVSFLFSLAGYLLGARFGDIVNKKVRPELIGGLILIAIGIRILVEHLGGMA
ncbi:MAG: manganese efflux pump MntP family protein [Bacteroidales bacterium]|nr:manganese efflux pump MntP family protein [Bacteroidales bacterium]